MNISTFEIIRQRKYDNENNFNRLYDAIQDIQIIINGQKDADVCE